MKSLGKLFWVLVLPIYIACMGYMVYSNNNTVKIVEKARKTIVESNDENIASRVDLKVLLLELDAELDTLVILYKKVDENLENERHNH